MVEREGNSDCGCGLRAIGGRYNDFAFDLRTYRIEKNHELCGGCVLGKGPLEDGLHILWRTSLPAGRRFIVEEYRTLRRLCLSFCQHGINKILKERTAMLKMGENT